MRIDLSCAECGSNNFSLDQGMSDRSLVICVDCGREIGTMAILKSKVAEEVLKRSSGGADDQDI
jgi:predicted nucleic acid-binding Zn ribbon protein